MQYRYKSKVKSQFKIGTCQRLVGLKKIIGVPEKGQSNRMKKLIYKYILIIYISVGYSFEESLVIWMYLVYYTIIADSAKVLIKFHKNGILVYL